MLKSKRALTLVLASIISLSACTSTVKMNDALTDVYKSEVDAYVSARYPDKSITLDKIYISETSKTGIMAYCYCDLEYFSVYNIGTDAICDDLEYKLYQQEAEDVVLEYVKETYGEYTDVDFLSNAYLTTLDSPISANFEEYIANNDTFVFVVGVSGSSKDKTTDLIHFSSLLDNSELDARFGIFYYHDYSTLNKDLNVMRVLGGSGKFDTYAIFPNGRFSDLENAEWSASTETP